MKKLLSLPPVRFITEFFSLVMEMKVMRSAAELAYFLVLTIFPLLMMIIGIVGLLPISTDAISGFLQWLLPSQSEEVLEEYIQYVLGNQSQQLFGVGLVVMVTAASAAFRSLISTAGELYGRPIYPSPIQSLLVSVLFSLAILVVIYFSIIVVLTGQWFLSLLESFLGLYIAGWQWLRFLLLFAIILLFFSLLYRATAPRGKPRAPVLPGAGLAATTLVVGSAVFSAFISMSTRYPLVYGSLASVIILLVWLYFFGNVLLFGIVFNCICWRRKEAG